MANEFKIKKGLIVTGASGGTVVDIQGSQGQLFSVTDNLSGSIFAVSDISGVPILDVNSSGISYFDGKVGIGESSPDGLLHIHQTGSGTSNSIITEDDARKIFIGRDSIKATDLSNNAAMLYLQQHGGNATFGNDVIANGNIKINTGSHLFFDGGTNATYISEDVADRLRFFVGGAEFMRFTESTADTVTIYKDTTFGTQAFATTATSSGDGSSTLTTKGYVDGLITGATIYRGTWNPDKTQNSGYGVPDLSTVTQTSGYYYICSDIGIAEPNGTGCEPNSWAVGDWVIWNDDVPDCPGTGTGAWQKIDNTSVLSGVGTGQTVALWEGAGSVTDSETLGNAPITVSGNNATFAGTINSGAITSTGKITGTELEGTSLDINGNADILGQLTVHNTLTVNKSQGSSALTINHAGNGGWTQYASTNDGTYGYIGAGSHLLSTVVNDNDFVIRAQEEFAVSIAATEKMRINSSGNATFAGDITVTGGDITIGTDAIAGNINSVGDVLALNVDSNTGGGAGANIQLKTAGTTQLTVTSSSATFAGNVTLTGGSLSISGDGSNAVTFTETGAGKMTVSAADDIILDAGSDIVLDAGGDDLRLKVSGTEYAKFNNSSSNLNIFSSIQDKSIKFIGNDNGTEITALTLNMADGGDANFLGTVTAPTFLGDLGATSTINTGVTGTTQTAGNNSTKIATTAYADAAAAAVPIGNYLPLAGGTLSSPGDLTVNGDVLLGGSAAAPKTITIQQIGVTTTDTNAVMQDGNGVLKIRTLGTGAFGPTPVGAYLPLSAGSSYPLTGDLYITKAATPLIQLTDTTNSKTLLLGVDDANAFIRTGASENLYLQVNGGTNAITILNNSNVGIGDTNPGRKLVLDGTLGTPALEIKKNTDRIVYLGTGSSASADDNTILHLMDQNVVKINLNTVGDSYLNGGNVGIGVTSPKAKLDINGHFCVDSKTHSITDAFTTCLTVNLNSHTGCHVVITAFGDWGSHSSAAYRGEFFLQNGANGYSEPGIILRQDDNTSDGTDQIICQIVDPTSTANPKDFEIQIRHTDTVVGGFSAQLTYTVQGKFNSIT